jgi:2-oxoglutarate dehydrogenase complex dehydrogenase (E1) component-like enzyme
VGPDDRYTVISADTHAGGSHAQYREYLDEEYKADFDAWREKYKNPFKDLKDTDQRIRNWDSDRRDTDQHGDGVVGEVIFPRRRTSTSTVTPASGPTTAGWSTT